MNLVEHDSERFGTVDVLTRIIAPLGSALIALTQYPGTGIGNWFITAVFAVGLFVAVNQSVEMIDRRYNPRLH